MFFDGSMKYFVARQQSARKPLHLSIYIFKLHLWINNNTDGMYCCLFIVTVVNANVPQCCGTGIFSTLFSIQLFLVFQTKHFFFFFSVYKILGHVSPLVPPYSLLFCLTPPPPHSLWLFYILSRFVSTRQILPPPITHFLCSYEMTWSIDHSYQQRPSPVTSC